MRVLILGVLVYYLPISLKKRLSLIFTCSPHPTSTYT